MTKLGREAFLSGFPPGKIRDLIPGVSGLPQQAIGNFVFRGLIVGVWHGELPAGYLRSHLGSLFDDQRVSTDVIRFHCDGLAKRNLPILQAFARSAVNEINRDI